MASRRTSYRRAAPVPTGTAAAPYAEGTSSFSGITDPMTRNSLLYAVAQDTRVTVSDGTVFQGVFSGTESTAGELSLVLRYAKVVVGDSSKINIASERRGNTAARLRIPVRTLVRMDAPPLSSRARPGSHNSAATNRSSSNRGPRADPRGFATDGQISARVPGQPRTLQKFEDFTEIKPMGSADAEAFGDLALAPRGEKWDQFQANEAQFGVQTSFNEDEYTTKIDRSSADFVQRQREAARLAAEIENKATSNIHQLEERNQPVPSHFDEEDRYSGVLRPGLAQQAAPKPDASSTRHSVSYVKQGVSSAKLGGAGGKSGAPSAKPVPVNPKPAPSKASSNKQGAMPGKHAAVPVKPGAGPAKPVSAKAPKSGASKSGTASSKNSSGPVEQSATQTSQKPTPNGVPSRPKSHPQHKMSYAAAAGAKHVDPAPIPANTAPVAPSDAPRPPPSPLSSANPVVGTTSPTAPAASTHIPPRSRESVQSARASNGGRTPPNHGRSSPIQGRNSPLSPNNHETSAVDALSLEATTPKIAKKFEQFKAEKKRKSLAENRQLITNDLKKFSKQHGQKNSAKQQNKVNQQAPVREPAPSAAPAAQQGARATPKMPVAGLVDTPGLVDAPETAVSSNGSQRSNKTKVESGAAVLGSKSGSDSNGVAPAVESQVRQQQTDKTPAPSTESVVKGAQTSAQSSAATNRRKSKMKLNPNATAWQPTSGPTPVVSATVPTAPIATMPQTPVSMEAYFQPMGNFAPVSAAIPEQQPAPGMPYPMGPAPIPRPHSMPGYAQQPSYPVMMPGAMPQMAQAPGYGYMPRGTFMVPGGGNRFPPAAPPAGMGFGIPVGMIPPQGNQRNPGYQFFSGQGYLPVQPPLHQPGIPPAYASHPGHAIPSAPVGIAQPQRNSMGSGRRGGAKGRGRQQHQAHHQGGHGQGYSGGYSGNESHQNHHQNHHGHSSQYSGGPQWYPVMQGDAEKGEGAAHDGAGPTRQPVKGGAEQGATSTTNAPQQ